MPTLYLRPAAIGDSDQWHLLAGASKLVAVSDTKDITYVGSVTATEKDLWTLESCPSEVAAITSIDAHLRWQPVAGSVFGAQIRSIWKLGGTTVNGATADGTDLGDFIELIDTTISRPGGGSWAVADLATLQLGYEAVTVDSGNDELHVSASWIAVHYTEADGTAAVDSETVYATRTAASNLDDTRTAAANAYLED